MEVVFRFFVELTETLLLLRLEWKLDFAPLLSGSSASNMGLVYEESLGGSIPSLWDCKTLFKYLTACKPDIPTSPRRSTLSRQPITALMLVLSVDAGDSFKICGGNLQMASSAAINSGEQEYTCLTDSGFEGFIKASKALFKFDSGFLDKSCIVSFQACGLFFFCFGFIFILTIFQRNKKPGGLDRVPI